MQLVCHFWYDFTVPTVVFVAWDPTVRSQHMLSTPPKRQRGLYEDFMASSETRGTLASGSFIGIMNVLMQLRKACNHPFLFPGAVPVPIVTDERIRTASAKMQVLDRLLTRLREGGHRSLLYSQFTQVLDLLEDYLR